ncbi:MAG: hypothetical protein D6768_09680 [Chloroflexi bacterium]|nr:MAG: hypothetical protein D6768_09680 [Chloroflexota bacterium]
MRYFNTLRQQMVAALESRRLLADSQRRAHREEIIRDITSKIRNATTIDDIMKTTVTELGKVVGTSRGKIVLGAPTTAPPKNGGNTTNKAGDSTPDNEV